MASSSRNPKEKEPFKVQLVSKEVKQPDFRPIPKVAYKNDPASALSVILPKAIMVQDSRKCYNYNIGWIGDMEICEAYNKLCKNGLLKDKFNIFEKKRLMCALYFPTIFKIEWIGIVLSRIHDGCIWLEGGTIKLTKKLYIGSQVIQPQINQRAEK